MRACREPISRRRENEQGRTVFLRASGRRAGGQQCGAGALRGGGGSRCNPASMLPRRLRVPMHAFLRGRPRTAHTSPLLTVKVKSNTCGRSRFGVVVSTAVDRRATVRHRLKRVVCAAARALPALPPSDIVFFLARPAARLSREEVRAEVARALASLTTHH
jgi:ribonuclease P protein component